MHKDKQLFQAALEVIIDGVAVTTSGEGRAQAGQILLEALLLKYAHVVDDEQKKTIESIVKMAGEIESPFYS